MDSRYRFRKCIGCRIQFSDSIGQCSDRTVQHLHSVVQRLYFVSYRTDSTLRQLLLQLLCRLQFRFHFRLQFRHRLLQFSCRRGKCLGIRQNRFGTIRNSGQVDLGNIYWRKCLQIRQVFQSICGIRCRLQCGNALSDCRIFLRSRIIFCLFLLQCCNRSLYRSLTVRSCVSRRLDLSIVRRNDLIQSRSRLCALSHDRIHGCLKCTQFGLKLCKRRSDVCNRGSDPTLKFRCHALGLRHDLLTVYHQIVHLFQKRRDLIRIQRFRQLLRRICKRIRRRFQIFRRRSLSVRRFF